MAAVNFGPARGDDVLRKILDLQARNLRPNLTAEQQASQGFVTFRYDLDLLREMNDDLPHVVASQGDKLAGYALSTTVAISRKNELLRPLVERLDAMTLDGRPFAEIPYYVIGQVCVAEAFRGQGVFDGLYQTHRALHAGRFAGVVTEISVHNTRSMAAHRRVGFRVIDEMPDGPDRWALVVWNWTA
jgi:ribosomal protein S18 acetylase RimI-like enzyme